MGLNVSLPQIQLQLAGRQDASVWLASYGTVCSIFACAGLFLGGFLLDYYRSVALEASYFSTIFTISFVARLVSCVFLIGLFSVVRRSR